MKVKSRKVQNKNNGFDSDFIESEQLPKEFAVNFNSIFDNGVWKTKVVFDGVQVGDIITDNSRVADGYRFHDIFHFSFATILGWSPCIRSMLNRKRKSNTAIDDHEDGARAAITEEAVSLLLFFEAKSNNFFEGHNTISETILRYVKGMTAEFEVNVCSPAEWEKAILISYEMFRKLNQNGGGTIQFDAFNKVIYYGNSSNTLAGDILN